MLSPFSSVWCHGKTWSNWNHFLLTGNNKVCLVIVFCFYSQKLIFVLFSNFGFKYGFLPFLILFFFFGDCFQLRIFIYNCHLFHSLHMTFTPLNPSEPWQHWESLIPWEPPRESHKEPPLRATQGSRELFLVGRRETHATVWPPFLSFIFFFFFFFFLFLSSAFATETDYKVKISLSFYSSKCKP